MPRSITREAPSAKEVAMAAQATVAKSLATAERANTVELSAVYLQQVLPFTPSRWLSSAGSIARVAWLGFILGVVPPVFAFLTPRESAAEGSWWLVPAVALVTLVCERWGRPWIERHSTVPFGVTASALNGGCAGLLYVCADGNPAGMKTALTLAAMFLGVGVGFVLSPVSWLLTRMAAGIDPPVSHEAVDGLAGREALVVLGATGVLVPFELGPATGFERRAPVAVCAVALALAVVLGAALVFISTNVRIYRRRRWLARILRGEDPELRAVDARDLPATTDLPLSLLPPSSVLDDPRLRVEERPVLQVLVRVAAAADDDTNSPYRASETARPIAWIARTKRS